MLRVVRLQPLPISLALLTACAVAPASAQQRIQRALPLAADASVRIALMNGSLRIVGWGKDSLSVTGTAPRGQPFHIGGSGRAVKMGVWDDVEGKGGGGGAARLEVHLPERARVWVKTGPNAEVDVAAVTGGLDLNIVGGRIRVTGSPREVNAEAMDGSVEIDASATWLRAKTASGPIVVRGSAEDVGLSTVSGSIAFTGDRVERGRFESVTGNIHFRGAPARSGALHFDSHSGTIDVQLPATAGLDIQVTSISGSVENRLNSRKPITARDGRGRELAMLMGDGAARVTIRTFKGAVLLRPL